MAKPLAGGPQMDWQGSGRSGLSEYSELCIYHKGLQNMFLSDIKYVPIKFDLHAAELASNKPSIFFFSFLGKITQDIYDSCVQYLLHVTVTGDRGRGAEEEMLKSINVSAVSLEIKAEYLGVGEGFTPRAYPHASSRHSEGDAPQPLTFSPTWQVLLPASTHVCMQSRFSLVGHYEL